VLKRTGLDRLDRRDRNVAVVPQLGRQAVAEFIEQRHAGFIEIVASDEHQDPEASASVD
jgi:hypothetical protein